MAKRVILEVRTLAGETIELNLDDRCSVREAKCLIESRWPQAPALAQRLLHGAEVVGDGVILQHLFRGKPKKKVGFAVDAIKSEPVDVVGRKEIRDLEERSIEAQERRPDGVPRLKLMMLIALEEALHHFVDTNHKTRRDALMAFTKIAPKANKGAIASVASLLGDPAAEVRACAVRSMVALSNRGDERALNVAISLASDSSAVVRLAAMRALIEVAAIGCTRSISLLSDLLKDPQAQVRSESLEALSHIAPGGSEEVITSVLQHLHNKRPEVRVLALRAIVRASSGLPALAVERVIEEVSALVNDIDGSVKLEVAYAFSQLIPNDMERAIALAAARLKHAARADARLGALRALQVAAPRGNDRAINALLDCIKDPAKGLRIEALKVLANLGTRGDSRSIIAVGVCLGDPRPETRLVGLHVLPGIVHPGDQRAQAAANALLQDDHEAVRREAAKTLRMLVTAADCAEKNGMASQGPLDARSVVAAQELQRPSSANLSTVTVGLPTHANSSSVSMPVSVSAFVLGGGAAKASAGIARCGSTPAIKASARNPLLAAARMLVM